MQAASNAAMMDHGRPSGNGWGEGSVENRRETTTAPSGVHRSVFLGASLREST